MHKLRLVYTTEKDSNCAAGEHYLAQTAVLFMSLDSNCIFQHIELAVQNGLAIVHSAIFTLHLFLLHTLTIEEKLFCKIRELHDTVH